MAPTQEGCLVQIQEVHLAQSQEVYLVQTQEVHLVQIQEVHLAQTQEVHLDLHQPVASSAPAPQFRTVEPPTTLPRANVEVFLRDLRLGKRPKALKTRDVNSSEGFEAARCGETWTNRLSEEMSIDVLQSIIVCLRKNLCFLLMCELLPIALPSAPHEAAAFPPPIPHPFLYCYPLLPPRPL